MNTMCNFVSIPFSGYSGVVQRVQDCYDENNGGDAGCKSNSELRDLSTIDKVELNGCVLDEPWNPSFDMMGSCTGLYVVPSSAVRIVSYNVENLFDDIDDPLTKDEGTPPKSHADMVKLAQAISLASGDVVTLQEVENIDILNDFVDKYLSEQYPYRALVEGNDIRGIDVAVISKYPITNVVSHKKTRFPLPDGKKTFLRRDLLRVDIDVGGVPLAVYTTHLKAHSGGRRADEVRLGEAKEIRRIIQEEMQGCPEMNYVLTGDFNDPPESEVGHVFLNGEEWHLHSALANTAAEERVTHPPTGRTIDYLLFPEHMNDNFCGGGVQYLPKDERGSDHLLIYGDFNLAPTGML